ncbi:MAG TPA: hypothetical protein DDW30_07190 [Clostridiales bacterium]|nr:hypothetical protein [Clostridiales bacterium]
MIIFIIIAVIAIVLLLKTYRLDTRDTVIAFSGGLGSGKTFLSVRTALRALRWSRFLWRVDKLLHPLTRRKDPRPELYSSIPIRTVTGVFRKKEIFSHKLTPEILLLQERIPLRSVVMIDEIGSFMSQFEYRAVNADRLDEFVRLFRHYTLGGKFICNDQCSENIVLQVRRRLNTVYNLMRFRKVPLLPVWHCRVRNIIISEEIKTVQTERHAEDEFQLLLGLMPSKRRKNYDTYCYSRRYLRLWKTKTDRYTELKKDDLLKNPTVKVVDLIEHPMPPEPKEDET